MTAERSVQPELQLRDFIRILKRRKGIIWACLILSIVGAVVYALMAPPTYRSIARILVDADSRQDARIDNDPVKIYGSSNLAPDIESQMGVLQSPEFLRRVFDTAQVTMPSQDDLDQNVIQIRQLGSSNIVDVNVSLPSKEDAQKIALQIPKAYGEFLTNSRNGQVTKLLQFTENRLKTEQANLKAAEQEMAAFSAEQAAKGNIIVSRNSPEDDRGARLRQDVFELNAAKAKVASSQQQVDSLRASIATLPQFRNDPATSSAYENLNQQKARVSALREKLESLKAVKADDHPDVLAAKAEYDQAKAYLDKMPTMEDRTTKIRNPELDFYQRMLTDAEAQLRGGQASVAALTKNLQDEEGKLQEDTRVQTKREELQRKVDLDVQSVATFSKALDDIQMRTNSVKDPLTQLMVSAAEQVSPKFVRSIIIGILFGIMLGLVAALIRDRTDDRIYTLDQIQESCGVLALGRVPQAERVLALVPGTERGQSTALESYRSLRFSLDSNKDGFVESVVLTSATAAEGRAELAYNVAVEAARDLRRTILVDADLRKPTLHQVLGVPESPGLSDYLSGKATLEEILHSTLNNYLTFIPAGSPSENPLQLLTSPQMATLHAELQKRADAIVFNSPSLLRYADGRAIAKIANSAILVAKKGVSRRNALRYCAEMLRRTNARLLGVVLNDSAASSSDVPYFYSEEASA